MKKEIVNASLIISIFSIFTSCQTTMNLIYGTNKSKTYASKSDYLTQNFQDKNIDTDKVYFLQKEAYNQLANDIISKKLSIYYGISGKYFISGEQMSVKSCSDQFETLYAKTETDDLDLQKTPVIDNTVLQRLELNPNKKTAIFIYSYKFGRMNNSTIFDVIKQLEKDDQFDYRLIAFDNSDIKS